MAQEEELNHDCLEHLVYREHEWIETHGLDCGPYERCYQEWWECTICGEEFTAKELDEILSQREKEAEPL